MKRSDGLIPILRQDCVFSHDRDAQPEAIKKSVGLPRDSGRRHWGKSASGNALCHCPGGTAGEQVELGPQTDGRVLRPERWGRVDGRTDGHPTRTASDPGLRRPTRGRSLKRSRTRRPVLFSLTRTLMSAAGDAGCWMVTALGRRGEIREHALRDQGTEIHLPAPTSQCDTPSASESRRCCRRPGLRTFPAAQPSPVKGFLFLDVYQGATRW